MKLRVFTVFDSKAAAYLPPFFMGEMGAATRAFKDCANDPSHAFGKHPEDYMLFCLGTFDDSTALFELLPAKFAVAGALELVERPKAAGEV